MIFSEPTDAADVTDTADATDAADAANEAQNADATDAAPKAETSAEPSAEPSTTSKVEPTPVAEPVDPQLAEAPVKLNSANQKKPKPPALDLTDATPGAVDAGRSAAVAVVSPNSTATNTPMVTGRSSPRSPREDPMLAAAAPLLSPNARTGGA